MHYYEYMQLNFSNPNVLLRKIEIMVASYYLFFTSLLVVIIKNIFLESHAYWEVSVGEVQNLYPDATSAFHPSPYFDNY